MYPMKIKSLKLKMYSPLEQFTCWDFTNIPLISNISLILILTTLLIPIINIFINFNPWNLMVNLIVKLYKELLNISKDHLDSHSLHYFPLLFTLFNFIGLLNILGLIPIVPAITSLIIFSMGLSFSIWLGIVILGLNKHKYYFSANFIPNGTPLILTLIMIPIELISFISRGISLGLRLCINITTGHLLIWIIGEFSTKFILNKWFISYLISLILITILMYLEFAIMLMQAYVFTMLTIVYISEIETPH